MYGQDGRKVQISFVPPPLENATYSVGVYDAKGRLVRRLLEIAPESAFTVGLNGLMTSWDGKDDAGMPVPPGRYAARGFAVGALKVEGVAIRGNDWSKDDEDLRPKRVEAITVLPDDLGLGILAEMPVGPPQVACYDGTKGELRWHKPLSVSPSANPSQGQTVHAVAAAGDTIIVKEGNVADGFRTSDGAPSPMDATLGSDAFERNTGKEGSTWKIEEGVLDQYSKNGERLRRLVPKPGEPVPVAVAPSQNNDRLYLLEETQGWQRVRGLSWVETKEEDGKQVSTWQTFFERDIRPQEPAPGPASPALATEIRLVENPLAPGKPQRVKVGAAYDGKGSYLTTADGLRLRQIGQRAGLTAVRVTKGQTANGLSFYQSDGAAWDEFSIEGARNIMAFDGGEIEMTANGEKTHAEKPAEPPDL